MVIVGSVLNLKTKSRLNGTSGGCSVGGLDRALRQGTKLASWLLIIFGL